MSSSRCCCRSWRPAARDLVLTGFESGELDRLLADLAPAGDPDDVPPLPAGVPDSKPGQVYELGSHRLMCGDATDPQQVAGRRQGDP